MIFQKWTAAVLAAALLCVVVGCGESGSDVRVSGSVTVDGKPIETGTISFVAEDGVAPTGGGPIKDGRYEAIVQPGNKTVLVLGNELVGEEPEYQGVPDSPMRPVYKTVTHPSYNAARLSPLKAVINQSEEGMDFDLSAQP